MSNAEIVQSQPQPFLTPVMNLALAKQRLQEFQGFVRDYLVEGEDFGRIPGTPKPTLLKPGADKLCELYGLSDDYEFIERVEDFDRGLFDYTIKCLLTDRRSGMHVSAGLGSCNSLEQRYRWRDSKRLCPQCGKDAIIKGKAEYGGGWICFAKKGGCGAKFPDDDESITGQTIGRVVNEDVADLKNTVLKMAKKRAKVDATLSATRSSGIFTQDTEDMPGFGSHEPPAPSEPETRREEPPKTQEPKRAAKNEPSDATVRKTWVEAFAAVESVEEFEATLLPLLRERVGEFVGIADEALMRSVFSWSRTVAAYNVVAECITKEAVKRRKDLVQMIGDEAKRRGYKVNRTERCYEEGAAA